MPKYVWEGRTIGGVIRRGELEGPNETAVRAFLRQQGIIPVKVAAKGREIQITLPFFKKKVKRKNVAVFTRQLAAMIDAGLPLVQALEILATQEENPQFKEIISRIKTEVEGGSTFAEALKKHPQVFDRLYVNLVVAGEESGNLDTILNRLATHIEKMESLKRKIRSAMVYPSIIVSVAIIVTAVLLVFVIPVFEKLFSGVGMSLPMPTQIVINVSKFTKANIPFVLLGLIIAAFLIRRYYKTESGRMQLDTFLLKMPIFGVLISKVSIARFARTLATLIVSGVPILDALDIVAATAGNRVVEKAIREGRMQISEGQTIAEPLARSGVFPLMVTHMISVGERTGALDQMLNKVADFYEEEVDVAVANLSSMIEPILIIFLGVVIGGLVISMYLPIFKMAAAF